MRRSEVVLVTGEAGIGKTRLVNEFVLSLDFPAVEVHRGHCIPLTRSRPLMLIADLLHSILGITSEDRITAQIEAVHAFCAQHDVPEDEVEPYVLSALGLTAMDRETEERLQVFDHEMLQRQTHAALRRVILAVASEKPVVLILDDIHWIDSASCEFLIFFLQSIADEPLMLVLIARQVSSETTCAQALALARKQPERFSEIELAPLDSAHTHVLLKRFIKADTLGRHVRRVIQQASILGRAFPVRLLQEMLPREDINGALEELCSCDFLQEEPFGIHKGYAFHHALLQEAIQATLLKRDRQELHYYAAEMISKSASWRGPERNELLAYHYTESRDPPKALPYLIAAAEQAARRHANDVVIDYCRRALAILDGSSDPRGPQHYGLEVILARAMKFVGQLADAAKLLRGTLDSVSESLRSPGLDPILVSIYIDILRELADIEGREGQFDQAYGHLEEGFLAATQWTESVGNGVRYTLIERMAWIRFQQGHCDEALKRADELLQVLQSQASSDPTLLANLFNTISGVLWRYGKHAAAEENVRRSLQLYHKIGYLFGKANAHANLGVLCYSQGKWREAAECFERADWIRREIGCNVGRTPNLLNLGLLYTTMGDHEHARKTLERALTIAQQLGEGLERTHALLRLAYLAIVEERIEDASGLVSRVRELESSLPPDERVQYHLLSALIEADRSLDNAIVLAQGGFDLARHDRVPGLESDSARVLGRLLIKRGRNDEGEKALTMALARSRAARDPYLEAQALFELGMLHRHRRNVNEATRMLEESLRIFTQLGAAYDAERVMVALHTRPSG